MIYEFKFPDIGEGISEGQIVEWKVNRGDRVKEGDIVAVIETDKVVTEIPTPKSGKIINFGAEEGDTIKVGETIVSIETSKEVEKAAVKSAGIVGDIDIYDGNILPTSTEGEIEQQNSEPDYTIVKQATPVARKIAADAGINIENIRGTGPNGRITKQDVLDRIDAGGNVQSKSTFSKIIKLTELRKTIVHNMEKSREIPSAVIHDFTVVNELINLRKTINTESRGGKATADYPAKIPISFLALFIKTLSIGLKEYPLLNSLFYRKREEIELKNSINIGFAVNTDRGLIVPVIKETEAQTLYQIQQSINTLIKKAQGNEISINDISGGTFTITNYGTYGGTYGRPMILPPQAAILGTGRIYNSPVVIEGSVVPASVLPVSLVFDHRVVDGAYAAGFLNLFLSLISNPYKILAFSV